MKAIIFDCDGMIVKSERFSERIARTESEQAIPITMTSRFFDNEFQSCLVGKSDMKDVLKRYVKEWGWKRNIDDLLHYWFDPQHNQIVYRFEPLIAEMRKRGVKVFVATNNEKYRTANLFNERGLGEWFDRVFSSYEIGRKKPDKAFFQYIIDSADLEAGDVVYWDDDRENVRSAADLGLLAKHYREFDDFKYWYDHTHLG